MSPLRSLVFAAAFVFVARAAGAKVAAPLHEPRSERPSIVARLAPVENGLEVAWRSGSFELRLLLANVLDTHAEGGGSSEETAFTPDIPRSLYVTATYRF
jgi:hypothetical protein